MAKITEANIIRSALWAAYGDAIGFPTELVSPAEFKKRNGLEKVSSPIEWRRRVGGMFGPDVPFPPGTYSDDTQLRLSTSRAINGNGFFDVESFAKVELPVWLNYALGAGRGSKAAAANLALRESTWSLNFFSSGQTKYWEGGGNGAAMRIQPHVWQCHGGPQQAFIADVIRNSICTHGHPRAILGALIHAGLLYETLQSGAPVHPSDWPGLGETIGQAGIEMLFLDPELPLVWVPSWERFAGRDLRKAWADTIKEWVEASQKAAAICEDKSNDPGAAYLSVLKELNAYDPAERGSGLKTPLYASVLAWLFRNEVPEVALAAAANAFGSDTDTIATMAGALIGAIAKTDPDGPLQDVAYLRGEASRMYHVGRQDPERTFAYPDLLSWNAPKSQSDAWVTDAEGDRLSGIGPIEAFGPTFKPRKGTDLVWQWATLEFGQTVLVKRRASQSVSAQSSSGDRSQSKSLRNGYSDKPVLPPRVLRQAKLDEAQLPLVELESSEAISPALELDLDALSQRCIRSGFDATEIGNAVLSILEGPQAIERAIGLVAIIAKAKVVRSNK